MHGKQMSWLNPAHPDVRERFIGLVMEVMQRCRVNGLQLDDHFAWPVEFGYDAYTSALYEQETGAAPPKDHTNRYWMTWRRRQLTGLLRELRQRLKKNPYLSASACRRDLFGLLTTTGFRTGSCGLWAN